jgi:general secretion pathway protein I
MTDWEKMTQNNKIKAMLSRKAGFTLMEVMIAMAILAIALLAVFQMQSQSISMAGEARFKTTASLLAQSKMADLEAAETLISQTQKGDFAPDYPEYAWTTQVTDTQIAKLKKIEVHVFRKTPSRENNYQLVLYKTSGM